jgi:hypothetical protein
MARTQRRLLYLTPEVEEMVKARAAARGVSINEWLNLAIKHALSGKSAVQIVETTTTQTKAEL